MASICVCFSQKARDPGPDARSGHLLSFFLPPIQEGQYMLLVHVTCNPLGDLNLPRKSMFWLTDGADMTIVVCRIRKTTTKQQKTGHYFSLTKEKNV